MIRSFLFILIFGFLTTSCGLSKKTTIPSAQAIFSKKEAQLILSGKAEQSMRVLLITNPIDSVNLRSKSSNFKVDPDNKVLQLLTHRLYSTLQDSLTRGVGIAAPQVGILKKIIWVQRFDKENEPFEV